MLWEHEPQAIVSNSARLFGVSIGLYKHDFKPISARAFLGLFSNI